MDGSTPSGIPLGAMGLFSLSAADRDAAGAASAR